MRCYNPFCDSTDVVVSGYDAMLMGIPTETFCYTCANAIALATTVEVAV